MKSLHVTIFNKLIPSFIDYYSIYDVPVMDLDQETIGKISPKLSNAYEHAYAPYLNVGKLRNKIRLVNASDQKIEFAFSCGKASDKSTLKVEPETGLIEPRNFIHVVVTRSEVIAESIGPLKLTYWKRDLLKKRRISVGSLIYVHMVKEEIKKECGPRVWLPFKLVRSLFIFAIITYNIFLIGLYWSR